MMEMRLFLHRVTEFEVVIVLVSLEDFSPPVWLEERETTLLYFSVFARLPHLLYGVGVGRCCGCVTENFIFTV